ncbi:hypothetical protein H0H93_011179 [Arthromyces matolae]|nr:hypothetical protein H0H93_011179 [Arthromyces matolae]
MRPSNPLSSLIEQFYGGLEAAKEKCSLGLLRHASKETIAKLPRLLLVVAEKEPNWLLKIDDDFAKALDDITERKPSRLIAKGHNHISPNWAVSSGEGEEWADDVIAWIRE